MRNTENVSLKVAELLWKWSVRELIVYPLVIILVMGSASPFCWHSATAVWRQAWQCGTVGLRGAARFPSLILLKLHYKLLQHLFFPPDLHSLNKGGDLYGKGMRSVSPLVVPWVSHHHMILVMELKKAGGPRCTHLLLMRPWGDIRKTDTRHTTQHADPTTGDLIHLEEHKTCVQSTKERQGLHMLMEREECCLVDHKQRNNWSPLPRSFLLARTDGLESDCITSDFLWRRLTIGSVRWMTSASNNELTSFKHMIIVVTKLNSMDSCKVVNISTNWLKGIFKAVFTRYKIKKPYIFNPSSLTLEICFGCLQFPVC